MKIAILWAVFVLGSAAACVDAAPVDAASPPLGDITADAAALSSLAVQSSPRPRVVDQPNAILTALKRNDYAALIAAMSYSDDLDQTAREWNELAQERREALAKRPADEHTDAHSLQVLPPDLLDKLSSDEGVERLVAEWEPMVAEGSSRLVDQFNLGFGAMLAGIAADQQLPFDRAQQLTDLLRATQAWTARTDFADRARLHRSLMALSRVLRQTGAKNMDDFSVLSFEDAALLGESLLAAGKQILSDYGIPVDEILESVRFSEVEADGDRAVLRIEGSVFGVALTHDVRMRYYSDVWMQAELADNMQEMFGELAQASPEAHQEAIPEMSAEGLPATGERVEATPPSRSNPSLGCKREKP